MKCYPDYYKNFKCTADKCAHNCCIGWEIDIDPTTLSFYENHKGEFKERFEKSIDYSDTPHFITDENERCPFLNENNLCDIILHLGEDHICDICTQHPRFHNELPGRIESGLGLCCEQACKIILTKKEKVTLICDEEYKTDDEIILLRDEVIKKLQDREQPLYKRIENMLSLLECARYQLDIDTMCNLLLSLERLDNSWGELLLQLKAEKSLIDYEKFDSYMKDRVYEYEQFCVYLIYRHFANAPDLQDAKSRAGFVSFSYDLVRTLGAYMYCKNDKFTFEDQVELMRMFSSEIEYSDDNLHTLFDVFY